MTGEWHCTWKKPVKLTCDGLAMWQFEIPVVEYIRRRPVGCSADATETKPNQRFIITKVTIKGLWLANFKQHLLKRTFTKQQKPKKLDK